MCWLGLKGPVRVFALVIQKFSRKNENYVTKYSLYNLGKHYSGGI